MFIRLRGFWRAFKFICFLFISHLFPPERLPAVQKPRKEPS